MARITFSFYFSFLISDEKSYFLFIIVRYDPKIDLEKDLNLRVSKKIKNTIKLRKLKKITEKNPIKISFFFYFLDVDLADFGRINYENLI